MKLKGITKYDIKCVHVQSHGFQDASVPRQSIHKDALLNQKSMCNKQLNPRLLQKVSLTLTKSILAT